LDVIENIYIIDKIDKKKKIEKTKRRLFRENNLLFKALHSRKCFKKKLTKPPRKSSHRGDDHFFDQKMITFDQIFDHFLTKFGPI